MATINYTPMEFINKYSQLPDGLQKLLLDAVAYWEKANPGQKVKLPTKETPSNGGAHYEGTPPNLTMTVKTGSGGRVPISSIDGRHTLARPQAPAWGCI